jgi:serine/threonine protein kinase
MLLPYAVIAPPATLQTTPSYRAPEMVDLYQRRRICEKADVWAMGCLMYKLVFFDDAFGEGGAMAILGGRFVTTPPSPSSLSPFLLLIPLSLHSSTHQHHLRHHCNHHHMHHHHCHYTHHHHTPSPQPDTRYRRAHSLLLVRTVSSLASRGPPRYKTPACAAYTERIAGLLSAMLEIDPEKRVSIFQVRVGVSCGGLLCRA